ncbi:Y-family DNA polymerase [Brasilonema sp. CT11]|nr:Y-family DNA polymerase [Brasilonema sp. CT11]
MFALIDCNSFYASCEQAFNPALRSRPVVVLSNNDGCVIARSKAAKALGVPMAAPYFQIKKLCERHNVAVCSSNYELYGDISRRVMSILADFSTESEVYSIDEMFLNFSGFDLLGVEAHALKIVQTVWQWAWIPVCVGIGPTKTLAKVANAAAKKQSKNGVFILQDQDTIKKHLAKTPIEDVWGIGRRTAEKLLQLGVKTAGDFTLLDARLVRQQFGVVYERTLRELQGVACLKLEDIEAKKNICSSRSFSRPVTELAEMEQAVTLYMTRAAEKLRAQDSYAQAVMTFIQTNRFKPLKPQHYAGKVVSLVSASQDTCVLIKAAIEGLRQGFKLGFQYQKAGVMLLDLIQNNERQFDLFTPAPDQKRETLMKTIDNLNNRFGRHTAFFGSAGLKHDWQMRCNHLSKRYTTQWDELPTCH